MSAVVFSRPHVESLPRPLAEQRYGALHPCLVFDFDPHIGKSAPSNRQILLSQSRHSSSSTSSTSHLPPLQSCSERPESGSSASPSRSVSTARNSILDPSSSTKQQASGLARVSRLSRSSMSRSQVEDVRRRPEELVLFVLPRLPPRQLAGWQVRGRCKTSCCYAVVADPEARLGEHCSASVVVRLLPSCTVRTECEFPPRLSGTHSVW